MRKLLLWFAPLALAQAEFLDVKLQIDRMDCATCLKSLELGLKKLKGVEKVAVNPEFGAEFTLQKANRLTLEQLRDTVKNVGFPPGLATVIVRGKPITSEGRWRFEVDGLGKVYNLSSQDEAVIAQLNKASGSIITVRASSPAPPDPRTTPSINVLSIVEP